MRRSSIILSADAEHGGHRWRGEKELRIGSDRAGDVVLADPSLAPRHARVFPTLGGWAVADLSTPTGTFLNRVRLGPDPVPLRTRDVLHCGSVRLAVTIVGKGTVRLDAAEVEAARQLATRPSRSAPLRSLARANSNRCRGLSLTDFLRQTLDDLVAALDARRGYFLLCGADDGPVIPAVVSPPTETGADNRPLTLRCLKLGESFHVPDVADDLDADAALHGMRSGSSSVLCALLRSPRGRFGVLQLERGPDEEPFTEDELLVADAVASVTSSTIECVRAGDRERDLLLESVVALARAVELRDRYTGDHTRRVTDYATLLADAAGVSPAEREQVRVGTPLHDIGKIGVCDSILRKPGRLTDSERAEMERHPLLGAAMIEDLPALRPVVPIVRHHHERWDGRGYPDRLAGPRIDRLARIVAIADAFDAMTSDRPYRRALPLDVAFGEIEANAGKQFDPELARAFVALRPSIEALLGPRESLLVTA